MDVISSAYLFQAHGIESCLIKIKWSELTSHFSLHLWSICFQIHTGCSNFSGLTLVQFTPPQCQHPEASNTSPEASLGDERPDFPQLSMFGNNVCSTPFLSSLVKIHPLTYLFLYSCSPSFSENRWCLY